jgi:DNA-directed RNA polymerase subunit RPC12/RpoP
MQHNKFKCARCGKTINKYPALSRVDNKTLLCPDCGTAEALDCWFWYQQGFSKEEIVSKLAKKLTGGK